MRILLGYTGDHGLVGLYNPDGENNTIRNNKFGGFTANVVLVGTKPTFVEIALLESLITLMRSLM